jgi:Lhr-like helicase
VGKVRFYKRGQRFRIDGNTYILAQIDGNKISLINLTTGNRWADPFKTSDGLDIPYDELQKLIGSRYSFIKVSRSGQGTERRR